MKCANGHEAERRRSSDGYYRCVECLREGNHRRHKRRTPEQRKARAAHYTAQRKAAREATALGEAGW